MMPGNSTVASVDRKSVLVPGLAVMLGNPLGLDPRMAPEPVKQRKISRFTGTLGMVTLPGLAGPVAPATGFRQSEVVEANALAMPRKFPGIVTVAVSELDMVLSNPVEPNTATVPLASVVWACIAVAPKTAVRLSGVPANSVALDGAVSSMN